jgi:Fe-S oxidoreductase
MRRNFEIFKEEGIDSIITPVPSCYKMFLEDYPEILPDWNIQVKNIWEILLDRLKVKSRLIKYKAMETVTYHDSCYLGRYCNIYDEPREILELIGYEIREMADFKVNSMCCGSCGGLLRTNPEIADKIAKERILQAKRIGVKKIIVASIENYRLLNKNIGDSGIEVLELSEVLAIALGLKKKTPEEEEIADEEQILLETEANIRLKEEIKEEDYYDKEEDWEK